MKGKIPESMLAIILDSLDVELTLIDADDKIIAWTEISPKIFTRRESIMGTDIRKCHPENIQQRLEKLLTDLKSGEIDSDVTVIDCTGPEGEPAKIRIEYLAVRSSSGQYLGCLEICNYVE